MMNSIHYKNAYNSIFNQMPSWKQNAIKEYSEKNKMSGLLTDFISKVIETAEKEFENQSLMVKELETRYEGFNVLNDELTSIDEDMSIDNNNQIETIKGRIEAVKAFNETSSDEKQLKKDKANSLDKAIGNAATQLNKIEKMKLENTRKKKIESFTSIDSGFSENRRRKSRSLPKQCVGHEQGFRPR